MAKDRTPGNRGTGGPVRGGSTGAGRGGSSARGGGRGRTRPPTQVVTRQRRPWGLIAGAVAVVLFAVAAIGYALVQVNRSEANQVASADEIEGLQTFDYPAGQGHVTTPVDYPESPPVGGQHDGQWADCTGTTYDVDIRHENAVHSLEHGGVWITYNPDDVTDADIETLGSLADQSGRMMSPYAGLDSPISIQAWGNQLKVDSASDPRLEQFADFFTYSEDAPEPGASCENPAFIQSPLQAGDASADGDSSMPTDAPSTPTGSATPSAAAESTEQSEAPAG